MARGTTLGRSGHSRAASRLFGERASPLACGEPGRREDDGYQWSAASDAGPERAGSAGHECPVWSWSSTANRLLFDMEIDSKHDEWPEHDSEHRREGPLCATEVGEVVVRVGHEHAHDDIDDNNHPAEHGSPQD